MQSEGIYLFTILYFFPYIHFLQKKIEPAKAGI